MENTYENNYENITFKLIGCSTAAAQIEGAINKDGRTDSIWDNYLHKNNMINADIACDEYHKTDETIKLLKELKVDSYRLSISWSRILPDESGNVNEPGINFYRTFIDKLIKADIKPVVTIYHWDLPQYIQNKIGGWTDRRIVDYYMDYVKVLFDRFHDVEYWITHNEPRVVSSRGYGSSTMAPGLNNPDLIPIVDHHLLLTHGLAVQYYRTLGLKGKIGISLNLKHIDCFDPDQDEYADELYTTKNRNYLDPVLKGTYPDPELKNFIDEKQLTADLKIISEPIDFLGINYYSRDVIAKEKYTPTRKNSLGWETYPKGIYELLTKLNNDYKLPPIIITENGYCDESDGNSSKMINDVERIEYIAEHVNFIKMAISKGVHVIGYMTWSLYDNFEWSFGYGPRFGLVFVNYTTLERIPKASFYEYAKFANKNKEIRNKQNQTGQ